MTLLARLSATALLLVVFSFIIESTEAVGDDIVCRTNCPEYCTKSTSTSKTSQGLEDCAEQCEITKWLQCSSGFGGCSFHETNRHFQSAKGKLASLRSVGLGEKECNEAMHDGTFPGHFQSCSQCKSVLYDALQDLSSAAQLAVHSGYDQDIVWTPKEALMHLQRCLCTSSDEEGREETVTVTKFSTEQDKDKKMEMNAEHCFWYAWFERVSGGGAVYSLSNNEDFASVLREQQSRGYHLVSSAWAKDTWLAWFKKMPPSSSSSSSYWVFEPSLAAFEMQLEAARRNGYLASSITFGPQGLWFAWFWRARAEEIVRSRWASGNSLGELLREMNLAVERGERLQALSFAEDSREWVAWFSTRMDTATDSSWIITPKFDDYVDYNERMMDQGFATSSAFGGDGLIVAWYDSNPNGVSDYFIDESHLGFVAALGQKLETEPFMMATTISYGCVRE
jgi:hypothetical protein